MSSLLKQKLETMLAKLNDYETIQKSSNPFSVSVTAQTVGEIKLFLSYAQLFLEKEIDLFMMLDQLSVKLTGTSLKNKETAINTAVELEKKEVTAQKTVIKADKPKKVIAPVQKAIQVDKGVLVPVESKNGSDFLNQIVKVICCAGIESNNPKVKKLGPNFLAKVLSDEGEMVKVQVIEKNFDPFIFSLPREDVELA